MTSVFQDSTLAVVANRLERGTEEQMRDSLIHFVCHTADHQQIGDKTVPGSPVTCHNGHWAFCPAGVPDDHNWAQVVPASLEIIRRSRALRETTPEETVGNLSSRQ